MTTDPKVLSKREMRWFWVGLFMSGPLLSFILGHDKHAELFVRKYSIFYALAAMAAVLIYRNWKGIGSDDPILRNSLVIRQVTNSVMLAGGNLISYAAINFIVKIL